MILSYKTLTAIPFFLLVTLALTGCDITSSSKQAAISYTAFNHTDRPISSIVINGEGGILNVSSYGGGGGDVCCVLLPEQWRPGLKVTIKWQESGHFARDKDGNKILGNDGVPILILNPFKERTIEVPKYGSDNNMGQFRIHFFPNDNVKITVLPYGPGHPNYPYPYPMDPRDRQPKTPDGK